MPLVILEVNFFFFFLKATNSCNDTSIILLMRSSPPEVFDQGPRFFVTRRITPAAVKQDVICSQYTFNVFPYSLLFCQ